MALLEQAGNQVGAYESRTTCDNHAFHGSNLERDAEVAHLTIMIETIRMPDRL
jgi:hypothetical protein